MPKDLDPNKIKKEFTIPKAFLTSLAEFSNGGFILISIAPNGEPVVSMQSDNQLTQLGLVKFASNFFDGIDKYNTAELRGEIVDFDGLDDGCDDPECDCHDDE